MKHRHLTWMFAPFLMLCYGFLPASAAHAHSMGSDDRPCMMQESGMGMMDDQSGMGACGFRGSRDGHGMMGGYGMGMMDRLDTYWHLDLNPQQRSRLNRIRYDLRRQQWNLKGKIIDEQAKLYDLYAAERPDPKRIGSVYGAIFDVRRQMIESAIDAMNRAKGILNKEQLARLQQLEQQCMRGGGPHGMTMHQPMSLGSGTP